MQLLARTTRSVVPTQAGAALLKELAPALEQIQRALAEVRNQRDRPAGRVRLVMSRNAAPMVLLPKLAEFTKKYPDITLDVVTQSGPVDLVAGEFDAGIQLGEYIQKDMIAVRVSRDQSVAIVGSPGYFRSHPIPKIPHDLKDHSCLGIRSAAGTYRWEFEKGRKAVTVSVTGTLVIVDPATLIQAALEGVGVGIAFEEQVTEHIAKKRLIRVLEDWSPRFPGFLMFYPSRRNQPAVLTALIQALRIR